MDVKVSPPTIVVVCIYICMIYVCMDVKVSPPTIVVDVCMYGWMYVYMYVCMICMDVKVSPPRS